MAFLGSAVRQVGSALRPPLPALCRTSARSYSSDPTKEKSVPYKKTLKQEDGASSGPTKPLPQSADVVVIGGGSLGCQTIYHLAKMGLTNAVLLERDRLTAGTTWHTAGLLWQLRPSDVEVELLAHTRNVVSKDLEEETGLHTGWIQNGGLFIASNKQRLDEYKRLMSLGKVYGIESHVLSPAETKDLYPLMNVDDLYGTLYVPKDGTMDPAGTCTTLSRAASARGATVIENCPVTRIQVRTDDLGVRRVRAVETPHGTIETPCVVNCAGVWATKLGEMAGVKVPLIAMHHAYVVTERIEGIQVSNLIVSGMMLGGGCGRELAHWIIHGRPERDMYGYDIRRFHSSLTDNKRWIRERSHESYAKNYSVVFPFDEPLASRNMRKDPFHQVLTEQGCVFQERHGWERPGWFNKDGPVPVKDYDYYGAYDIKMNVNYKYNNLLGKEYTFDFPPHHDVIKSECLSCRNSVAVFNMSYFGKFYLTGPDAKKAADWMFTADVNKKPGSTVYTCMLNKRGGAEADLTVSRLEPCAANLPLAPESNGDAYYLAIGGGVAEHNWNHIRTVLQDQGFRCQLTDHSEDMGMISIQGPKSSSVPSLSSQVRAMRLSFVGELGWELHIPKDSCIPVYRAVMAAGAKHGIINSGYRAIDSLSIEKGYRHWHADLRPDDTPLEAGLAFTCKLKSSIPFQGRERLEKQKEEGLKRRIVCFTIDEKVPMFGLEAVFRNGVPVGHLRRSEYGFFIDKTLAYGYIRNPNAGVVSADFIKSGEFTLERMGVTYKAKAHLKSPFDPENKRVKGIYD
ncbi:sarcosine dehydrogenase, mitochondrial [Nematolebias whitei]|uniref:sarcosine dehydrogenase, mitochondrial n=1 Tax=Nematolebias whitei TaxID=451745 RepID=UPI00189B7A25|nr:sarcosine dehydrogenase, mitochondrial [Nematolebias whitei]